MGLVVFGGPCALAEEQENCGAAADGPGKFDSRVVEQGLRPILTEAESC